MFWTTSSAHCFRALGLKARNGASAKDEDKATDRSAVRCQRHAGIERNLSSCCDTLCRRHIRMFVTILLSLIYRVRTEAISLRSPAMPFGRADPRSFEPGRPSTLQE